MAKAMVMESSSDPCRRVGVRARARQSRGRCDATQFPESPALLRPDDECLPSLWQLIQTFPAAIDSASPGVPSRLRRAGFRQTRRLRHAPVAVDVHTPIAFG